MSDRLGPQVYSIAAHRGFADALVAGLLFSTLLTLVMVPVMVTAPSVFKGRFIRAWGWLRRAKKPDQGDDAPKKPKNEPLPIDGEFIQAE